MQRSANDEAKRWMDQAEADFKSAQGMMENHSYDWACFAFQQSAEKALKAFLYEQGEGLVVGHSIVQLTQRCISHDPTFAALVGEVNGLDLFYISARYPNSLPDSIPARVYNLAEAERAQAMAGKVIKSVKGKLKRKKK